MSHMLLEKKGVKGEKVEGGDPEDEGLRCSGLDGIFRDWLTKGKG